MRFTPTHVGQRRAEAKKTDPGPVHPHARGAEAAVKAAVGPRYGSPPRTWGRERSKAASTEVSRFTPTHVGQRPLRPCAARIAPVHPHARGAEAARPAGPRERVRFTPTHVGQRPAIRRSAFSASVHPHARGAEVNADFLSRRRQKSWGDFGFTPTHVGQSW